MEPVQSSTPTKAKPGPKPKAKVDVDQLLNRIESLEHLVLRMAHNAGVSHSIIMQAGLEPFKPGKQHMSKMSKAAVS